MEAQIQTLMKQRRRLIVACGILALTVFVAGIYAFVQIAAAEAMQRQANEAMTRAMACEQEAIMQKKMAEMFMAEVQAARKEALRNSQRPSNNREK